jgi:hypothetical protein
MSGDGQKERPALINNIGVGVGVAVCIAIGVAVGEEVHKILISVSMGCATDVRL